MDLLTYENKLWISIERGLVANLFDFPVFLRRGFCTMVSFHYQ